MGKPFPLFSKLPHFQFMLPTSLGIISALSSSSCPVGVSQKPPDKAFPAFPEDFGKTTPNLGCLPGKWISSMGRIHGKLSLGTAHSLGKKSNWTPRPPGAEGIQLGFQLEPSENPRRIWERAQPLGTGSCFFATAEGTDFSFNPASPASHSLQNQGGGNVCPVRSVESCLQLGSDLQVAGRDENPRI